MKINKTIFLSGKISNLPFELVKSKFKAMEQLCLSNGFMKVFNPIENIDQEIPYEFQMAKCFEAINNSDIVFQIEDWMDSPGAREECVYAIEKGKEITNLFKLLHDVKSNLYSDFIVDHKAE